MLEGIRSYAKINLGLYIGGPRPDGYHSISTVYQTIDLHDTVSVVIRRPVAPLQNGTSTIRLTSNDARVPTDGRNTAHKMLSLVLAELAITADVEIHIEKRLPVQGGLGAGSGNAVAALLGFERAAGIGAEESDTSPQAGKTALMQWGKRNGASNDGGLAALWAAKRLELAAKVGSDVPLFLLGGATLGVDRGQEVYPLPDFEPSWCVVAIPDVGVSTPLAFRDWDSLCAAEGLTQEASADKLIKLSRAYASAFVGTVPNAQRAGPSGVPSARGDRARPQGFVLVRTGIMSWIENDFERVVFAQHPSLAEIKQILAASGRPEAALHASLSGSGSALFGLYSTLGDAEAACQRLQDAGVANHLTRTLPREGYWREMLT